MAISPLIYNKDGDESKSIATKVKSMAVRTNTSDGVGQGGEGSSEDASDPAEKMNQEIRDRYGKGD